MTIRNICLSLILSLALTFVGVVVYVSYPILSLVIGGFLRSTFSNELHTDGVAAVAGGLSDSILVVSLLFALASFLVILTLLQKRSRAKTEEVRN